MYNTVDNNEPCCCMHKGQMVTRCVPAGSLDSDCPIWDHVVQLFACCEDPDGSMAHCDRCDATIWLAAAQHGACDALRHPPDIQMLRPPPLIGCTVG